MQQIEFQKQLAFLAISKDVLKFGLHGAATPHPIQSQYRQHFLMQLKG